MELTEFINNLRKEGFIVDCNKNPRGSNKWVHIFNPNCELIYRFPVEGSHKVDNFKYRIFKSGKKKLLYMDQFIKCPFNEEINKSIEAVLYNRTVLDLIKNIKCICKHATGCYNEYMHSPEFELTTGKSIAAWDATLLWSDVIFKYIELTRVHDEDFNLLLNSEDPDKFEYWIDRLRYVIPSIEIDDAFTQLSNPIGSLVYIRVYNGTSVRAIGRVIQSNKVKIIVNTERTLEGCKINSRAGEIITFGLQ